MIKILNQTGRSPGQTFIIASKPHQDEKPSGNEAEKSLEKFTLGVVDIRGNQTVIVKDACVQIDIKHDVVVKGKSIPIQLSPKNVRFIDIVQKPESAEAKEQPDLSSKKKVSKIEDKIIDYGQHFPRKRRKPLDHQFGIINGSFYEEAVEESEGKSQKK